MTKKVIDMAIQKGQLTSSDLRRIGASRTTLAYLEKRGKLRRIARGVYVPADRILENETLQAVSVTVPHGVICLLSALQFHEITTQMPPEAWVAIERNQTIPRNKKLPLCIVQLSPAHFSCGIEKHELQGITLRVYSPAKTVVDCFKFRNKIGIDVAREALRDSIFQKKATIDEIFRYAKICRMLSVMRPYLEMV
ncbi:MAG: type IV toxin-antitoxin system AbiEi family antitoxin domain-containing protein, partial [Planctomycetota bacterium]|jgi:predicted transcriptional regulator of viral defense system